MKWVKVTDVLTHSIPETFIRYDNGQQMIVGDHVTVRDIWENGWDDIEYLDETPSSDPAEVLVKALEEIAATEHIDGIKANAFKKKCPACIAKHALQAHEQLKQQ